MKKMDNNVIYYRTDKGLQILTITGEPIVDIDNGSVKIPVTREGFSGEQYIEFTADDYTRLISLTD